MLCREAHTAAGVRGRVREVALRLCLEDEDGSGLVGGGGCHESGERGKNSKIESLRRGWTGRDAGEVPRGSRR